METYSCEICRGAIFKTTKYRSRHTFATCIHTTLTLPSYHGAFRHPLNGGGEDINIIPVRENDEFIKSNVDDLVPILRTFKVTLVSTDLQCNMPLYTPPLPCPNVLGYEKLDIDLPFGED
ncbi:hypothetical protein Tco_0027980 [Tanacetum coccineum]